MINYRILFIIFLLPLQAFAVREVVFRKTTMVYEKQSKDANVMTVYEKGERAPISSKSYGIWKKIVVTLDNEQKVGWVLGEDLKGARIIERAEPFEYETYHLNKWSIGILGAFNFMSQGARSITSETTIPPRVDVSSLSGTEIYFGVPVDIHWTQTFTLHLEFLFRKSSRSGTGQFVGGSDAEITLDQSFMSLGGMGKWYLAPESNFWYGAGLEVAKLTESKMTFVTNATSDPAVSNEGIDFPIFFMLTGGIGLDFHLLKKFFILPEIRAGVLVNSEPIVFTFEVRVPIVYTF